VAEDDAADEEVAVEVDGVGDGQVERHRLRRGGDARDERSVLVVERLLPRRAADPGEQAVAPDAEEGDVADGLVVLADVRVVDVADVVVMIEIDHEIAVADGKIARHFGSMLLDLYRATLDACHPERLMCAARAQSAGGGAQVDLPRNIVAIGKCAGPLLDAFDGDFDAAFVAMPEGYCARRPAPRALIYKGGHPGMTAASFAAGRALVEFVDAHDDITFLVSGGGSACVEVPLPPHTEEELIAKNRELVASGLPIGEINRVRASLSAIKGGGLGGRVRGRCVTFIYSDVSTGQLQDVASGPSLRDMRLIADNTTLVRTAARIARERGLNATIMERQIEMD